jgi:hypothetical protein
MTTTPQKITFGEKRESGVRRGLTAASSAMRSLDGNKPARRR